MPSRRLLLSLLVTLGPALTPVLAAKVEDRTRANAALVKAALMPTAVEEIQKALRSTTLPISIGGARFSQGGQILADDSLFIDMTRMNRIVQITPETKKVVVQAGVTWRDLQEALDPYNLSVEIMQSYANFSVGGALSVNAHGRYVGQGAMIRSVDSIQIVLADSKLVTASRKENSDLFFAAIGGYGGLGVIVEATLNLADNVKLQRNVIKLPTHEYSNYFQKHVLNDKSAVFHNGDLYPPNYDDVLISTFVKTDKPVTIKDRLRPRNQKTALTDSMASALANPFGELLREYVLDPLRLRKSEVVWRNYEASYDVSRLGTYATDDWAYFLQEYFIPVKHFDDFVPKLRDILRKHGVKMLNVAVRHARQDHESILAWARNESYSFVLYFKQSKNPDQLRRAGIWTRELTEAAISLGGTYYLPYQSYATTQQFQKAYPTADKFFAIKRKYDPNNRFRNKLWNKYLSGGG